MGVPESIVGDEPLSNIIIGQFLFSNPTLPQRTPNSVPSTPILITSISFDDMRLSSLLIGTFISVKFSLLARRR